MTKTAPSTFAPRAAWLALCVLPALAACAHNETGPAAPGVAAARLHISHPAERPATVGGPDWFTGQTEVAMLFGPDGARDFSGAYVTFQPGARTAWHSHPAGQTLVVTEGTGWVQIEGQPRQDIAVGDVVWTPPGVRHWHGATTDAAMTHLALQNQVEGRVVDWFEHVADEVYDPAPSSDPARR